MMWDVVLGFRYVTVDWLNPVFFFCKIAFLVSCYANMTFKRRIARSYFHDPPWLSV